MPYPIKGLDQEKVNYLFNKYRIAPPTDPGRFKLDYYTLEKMNDLDIPSIKHNNLASINDRLDEIRQNNQIDQKKKNEILTVLQNPIIRDVSEQDNKLFSEFRYEPRDVNEMPVQIGKQYNDLYDKVKKDIASHTFSAINNYKMIHGSYPLEDSLKNLKEMRYKYENSGLFNKYKVNPSFDDHKKFDIEYEALNSLNENNVPGAGKDVVFERSFKDALPKLIRKAPYENSESLIDSLKNIPGFVDSQENKNAILDYHDRVAHNGYGHEAQDIRRIQELGLRPARDDRTREFQNRLIDRADSQGIEGRRATPEEIERLFANRNNNNSINEPRDAERSALIKRAYEEAERSTYDKLSKRSEAMANYHDIYGKNKPYEYMKEARPDYFNYEPSKSLESDYLNTKEMINKYENTDVFDKYKVMPDFRDKKRFDMEYEALRNIKENNVPGAGREVLLERPFKDAFPKLMSKAPPQKLPTLIDSLKNIPGFVDNPDNKSSLLDANDTALHHGYGPEAQQIRSLQQLGIPPARDDRTRDSQNRILELAASQGLDGRRLTPEQLQRLSANRNDNNKIPNINELENIINRRNQAGQNNFEEMPDIQNMDPSYNPDIESKYDRDVPSENNRKYNELFSQYENTPERDFPSFTRPLFGPVNNLQNNNFGNRAPNNLDTNVGRQGIESYAPQMNQGRDRYSWENDPSQEARLRMADAIEGFVPEPLLPNLPGEPKPVSLAQPERNPDATTSTNRVGGPGTEAMAARAFGRAEANAEVPFFRIPVNRAIAGLAPEHLELRDSEKGNRGKFLKYIDKANQGLDASQMDTNSYIDKYTNPMLEDFLKITRRRADESFQDNVNKMNGAFLARGAWGSKANGDRLQRMIQEHEQSVNDSEVLARMKFRDQAANNFNLDRMAQMEGGKNALETGRAFNAGKLTEMGLMQMIGDQRRAYDQQIKDYHVNELQNHVNHPWDQLGKQTSIMNGAAPLLPSTTSVQEANRRNHSMRSKDYLGMFANLVSSTFGGGKKG